MSATTTLDAPNPTLLPAEVMLHLVATLLTPMFATATGGDSNLARTVAIETLNLYRTENYAGLIVAAQIIAFGLASIGSLSLSMAAGQDLSASMVLRLRANANAMTRTAEKLSRTALQPVSSSAQGHGQPQAEPQPDTAELQAGIAAARQAIAQAQSQLDQTPTQSQTEAQATNLTPVQPTALQELSPQEQQYRIMWASGMANVADEFIASLPTLPPAEQKIVSKNIAILNICMNSLLSGEELPELPAIPGLKMRPFPQP